MNNVLSACIVNAVFFYAFTHRTSFRHPCHELSGTKKREKVGNVGNIFGCWESGGILREKPIEVLGDTSAAWKDEKTQEILRLSNSAELK